MNLYKLFLGVFILIIPCFIQSNRIVTKDPSVVVCPKNKPLQDDFGDCYACDDKSIILMPDGGEDCSKICPNRHQDGTGCYLIDHKCPKERPLYHLFDGRCYPCDTTSNLWKILDCSVCPNRHMRGKYCVLNQCPADEPLMGFLGCYSCDIEKNIRMSSDNAEDCSKICPNRYLDKDNCVVLKKCSQETPLYDLYKQKCYACDALEELSVADCSICPNRHLDSVGNCILNDCPADKPLKDRIWGGCYACDDEKNVLLNNPKDCTKLCPNRYQDGEECFLLKECPKEAPLYNLQENKCYSCDDTQNLYKILDCSVCPNRHMKNGYCSLDKCPEDKPLKRSDLGEGCYSCDEEDSVFLDNPEDCTKLCPNRYLDGRLCYRLEECPKNRPLNDLFADTTLSKCCSCKDPRDLHVADCSVCPNRYISDDEKDCVLKRCPANKPLELKQGRECFSCDDPRKLDVKNCSVCPNRTREMLEDEICANCIYCGCFKVSVPGLCILKK